MSKQRRQQLLLGVLVLALLLVAGRQLAPLLSPDSSSARRAAGGPDLDRTDWQNSLPQVEELRLSALEVDADDLNASRDPFQIRQEAPPQRRPEPSQEDLRRRIEEARQRQQTQVQTPARPPAPTPPAVDVVYLGSFGSGRMRLAVFTDGNEIFNVPEGKVLKEKFVVVKIGLESADLGFVGFPDAPAKRLEIGG